MYLVWSDFSLFDTKSVEVFFRRSTDNGASFRDIVNLSNNAGYSIDPKIKSNRLDEKEREKSVRLAWKRSKIRKKFADKIGNGLYVMAVYEEMKRIVITIDYNYLFLITAELEVNHGEIIDHVLKLKNLFRN